MRIGRILMTLLTAVALSFSAAGTAGAGTQHSISESTTSTCQAAKKLTTHVDGELVKDIDTSQKFIDDKTLQSEIKEINSAIERNKQADSTETAQPEGVGRVATCLSAVLGSAAIAGAVACFGYM